MYTPNIKTKKQKKKAKERNKKKDKKNEKVLYIFCMCKFLKFVLKSLSKKSFYIKYLRIILLPSKVFPFKAAIAFSASCTLSYSKKILVLPSPVLGITTLFNVPKDPHSSRVSSKISLYS